MAGEPTRSIWPFGMTDLQEVLLGPDGETARREALAHLDTSLARLDDRLLAGLDPQRMTQARAVRQALDTARAVLADR
ncbi:hypothetical protein SAMN05216360_11682 [Methylobacterium phyllostachyos]|uniref:Uncharacterized protein n=1 Tax=Methylobacterium phyllostachyos TaxID=582672 RepID=A0A1H0HMZ6_9HYPH|nr:hypothetical protein [Methylobacterium phyllostachyos]SDO20434.1 hypothetical protein SAMN05216360_11682 [Methylobacterium phyllostachyos]